VNLSKSKTDLLQNFPSPSRETVLMLVQKGNVWGLPESPKGLAQVGNLSGSLVKFGKR
jgi:hypothetical protein